MVRLLTIALMCVAMALVGCSSVSNVWVTDDFKTAHRTKTYRLNVVSEGLAKDAKLDELWTRMAQRWVNHHRDFIAKRRTMVAADGAKLCTGDTQAVLWLKPAVTRKGDEVQASAQAGLFACPDGQRIWTAQASGAWPVADEQLTATQQKYVRELGAAVGPFVPATFRLLRELLDSLPRPKLVKDDDVMEKIEVNE